MLNETKKLRKFLREYFFFSTTERKGIIWLLCILILLISLPLFFDVVFPKQLFDINIYDIKSTVESQKTFTSFHKDEINNTPFNFDPNSCSDENFSQLGFSKFNIKMIRNYLSKGGKFKKSDDLKKIYGVNSGLYQKLEPFIVIRLNQNYSHQFSDSTKNKKVVTKKLVEINSADSIELVGLYRIGPATAAKIIDYRNKLGGFIKLEQLNEIWGFNEDLLYDLTGKIYVDASKAKIFNINAVTSDELKTHPYFKYKISNAIINYRKQHGSYSRIEDLKNIVIINDSIYKRISPYLKLN